MNEAPGRYFRNEIYNSRIEKGRGSRFPENLGFRITRRGVKPVGDPFDGDALPIEEFWIVRLELKTNVRLKFRFLPGV